MRVLVQVGHWLPAGRKRKVGCARLGNYMVEDDPKQLFEAVQNFHRGGNRVKFCKCLQEVDCGVRLLEAYRITQRIERGASIA